LRLNLVSKKTGFQDLKIAKKLPPHHPMFAYGGRTVVDFVVDEDTTTEEIVPVKELKDFKSLQFKSA